jgi:uncharacterized membrane protein YsdA (DUF1294 family)
MKILFIVLSAYLGAINLTACFLMYSDKKRAIKRLRRISEKRLFLVSFLGGSLGALFGMYAFRHKTRHMKFKIGLPLILFIQLAVVVVFVLCANGSF